MKASYLFKKVILCLLFAAASAGALFLGADYAKPFIFFFVIVGALLLLIGLVLLAMGYLENDVTS